MSAVIRTHSYCTGQKFISLTLVSQPFNVEMIGLKLVVQSVFLAVSKQFSRRHGFNVCMYPFRYYPPSRYAGQTSVCLSVPLYVSNMVRYEYGKKNQCSFWRENKSIIYENKFQQLSEGCSKHSTSKKLV